MPAENRYRLSALVVNWNGGELRARCLASIDTTLPPALRTVCELIVVDDRSSDRSSDRLPWQGLGMQYRDLPTRDLRP